MNRIPFDGSFEGSDSCPQCGALSGEVHKIGCMSEQCPKCGNLLATCTCHIFLPEDKALAVRRLYNAIGNPSAAWAFAAQYSCKSIIGLACWLSACLHDDPALIAAMALTDAGALSSARPSFCDAAGSPRYSAGDIARALGLGKRLVAEVERMFRDVTAAQKAEGLHRLQ